MVTKLTGIVGALREGSVLAKILMVTKHWANSNWNVCGSVLAKILMVTKLRLRARTSL